MAIGNLDRCITIQDYTNTRDEYGGAVKGWTTTATTKAWVKYKSGGESVYATKDTETADLIFVIRYRASLTTKSRIIYDGNTYDIKHIAEAGRRKYMEVTAKLVK